MVERVELIKNISVVIPVYNGFCWLDSIKESIQGNTECILEVILVNDGDERDFKKLIHSLQICFGEIIVPVVSGYRTGPGHTRNEGIKIAQAKYIAFLDCDDLWVSDSLRKRVALLQESGDVQFVYSSFENVHGQVCSINKVPASAHKEDLLITNFICLASVIIRKKLLEEHQFRCMKHEDLDLWIRLLSDRGTRAVGLKVSSLKKRIGHDSVSSNKWRSMLWHAKIVKSYLKVRSYPLFPFMLIAYIVNGFLKRRSNQYSPMFFLINKLIVLINGSK